MNRELAPLPLWATMVIILVGFPLVTVTLQAFIRKMFPTLKARKHNSVAGFLVAVIGVIYAVTVGFIISNQWENYTKARDRTFQEAFTLAGIAEGASVLGPPLQREIKHEVITYNEAVVSWWPRAGGTPASSDPAEDATLSRLLDVLATAQPTNEAQRDFIQRSTEDLVELNAQNDLRLHQSSRAHLAEPLWVVVLVSSSVTVLFCLMFGLENAWLHYLMVTGVSLVVACNVLLVVLLDHPLSGAMPISPDAYQSVIADLGG